jgi:hypothetical protein
MFAESCFMDNIAVFKGESSNTPKPTQQTLCNTPPHRLTIQQSQLSEAGVYMTHHRGCNIRVHQLPPLGPLPTDPPADAAADAGLGQRGAQRVAGVRLLVLGCIRCEDCFVGSVCRNVCNTNSHKDAQGTGRRNMCGGVTAQGLGRLQDREGCLPEYRTALADGGDWD